jgi:hypothetical protein
VSARDIVRSNAWGGFHDLPNGRFQLSRLPPPGLYVCVAKPHHLACYPCIAQDGCGWSDWDAYKVEPGVSLNKVAGADSGTISGLAGDLNRIVAQYLGRFCTSTHKRYINPGKLKDFCNYCQERGHEFELEECGHKASRYFAAQHVAEMDAREAQRRAWRYLNDRGVNPFDDAHIF